MTTTNPFHPRSPDQIAQAINEWYGTFAPPITSPYFAKFASNSHELAKMVCGRSTAIIHVTDAPTASVDLKHGIINLPLYYFSNEAMAKVAGTEDERLISGCAIASINGSTAHEALHLRYTPENLLEACNRTNPAIVKRYGQQLACTYLNIAEDLNIEHNGYEGPFGKFIHMKNAILFTVESFATSMAEALSAMGTKQEAMAAINALVHLKNVAFVDAPEWATNAKLQRAAQLLLTARIAGNRAEVALDVLSLFEVPDSSDDGKGEGGTDGKGESAPATEAEKQAAKIAKKDDEAEKIAIEFKVACGRSESDFAMLTGALEEYDIPNYPYFELHVTNLYSPQNFTNFARLLRQLKVRNHAPGSPRNKGSKIVNTRLARIGTDGKIFANSDGTKQESRLEAILLCDASGSMNANAVGTHSRWMVVLKVAQEVQKQLKRAGIPNSVYLHTSNGDGEIPTVAHIASSNMRVSNTDADARFDRAYNVDLGNNYDGVAIRCVAQKFTKRPSRKVLIVLSDGQPSGNNYGGSAADKHTKEAIEEARKNGVSVICFSLDRGVVEANNRLYGSKNNINCSGVLETEFRRVIAHLVAEGR